jgi:hypothetical protein
VTHTPDPAKAIAAAFWNTGIGHDVKSLSEISDEKAADALSEMFKSHLDGALEFASFNFFWEDIPIFMRAHLVRHRVGWGFAERSLRYYDAAMEDEVVNYDWGAMPNLPDAPAPGRTILGGQSLRGMMAGEMKRQVQFYDLLLKEGVDQQDARNVIGVWYPTNMQTTCTYRALRTMLASRLTSQAHPFWQKAAREIKALVTEVSPVLGAGLVDVCQIAGRCVWHSRFDRDCDDCIKRGMATAHEHNWTRTTSRGAFTQCDCGVMKPLLLP